jgi:tRNA(Arg) A34 adenosine deaminase TadA
MDPKFRYLKQAIDLAKENASATGGGPFGAVIEKDGKVISACSNSVTPDNDPTAHAEVNAIRAACRELGTFDLTGCTLYSSCEPCPMCLSAAYWARVGKIVYAADRTDAANAGFNDSFIYEELAKNPESRSIPIERLMQKEGAEPFDLWNENEKKIRY